MARCLHMYDSGFQCIDETIESTDFCEAHQKVVAFDAARGSRLAQSRCSALVALVLLILFLIPLLSTPQESLFRSSGESAGGLVKRSARACVASLVCRYARNALFAQELSFLGRYDDAEYIDNQTTTPTRSSSRG